MNRDEALAEVLAGNVRKVEGGWEVHSSSNPTEWHKVTWNGLGGSCDCQGFKFRHKCSHYELVKVLAPKPQPEEELLLDEQE